MRASIALAALLGLVLLYWIDVHMASWNPERCDLPARDLQPVNHNLSAPAVLLLHGFPDNPQTFVGLHATLQQQGFRVYALTLRGYHRSTLQPQQDYFAVSLAQDIFDFMKLQNLTKAHLVGHDWGSVAVQAASALQPQLFQSVTVMAVPHNMLKAFLFNPQQLALSWYMLFFQLPVLPKLWISHFHGIEFLWHTWSPGFTPTEEHLWSVLEDMHCPLVLHAALGYYRENLGCALLLPGIACIVLCFVLSKAVLRCARPTAPAKKSSGSGDRLLLLWAAAVLLLVLATQMNQAVVPYPASLLLGQAVHETRLMAWPESVQCPVLAIAGERDGCISPASFEIAMQDRSFFTKGSKLVIVPEAGHFIHLEQPHLVATEIIAWILQHS
eukprot:m.192338 g.192338  ORF g.192338 m.192338 type:complete len:385 (+) comp21736_c0_seq3:16-1170(+)